MTPLPAPLGTGGWVAWRLDEARFGPTWDSGEGAFRVGGRWNARGQRVVYCALEPATAILEVAVHKGFRALDTVAHMLTACDLTDMSDARVVQPDEVPNPHWLHPGIPSAGQQDFGSALLARHAFVVLPSVVSSQSWNLVFTPGLAAGRYAVRLQERFALDRRVHPGG